MKRDVAFPFGHGLSYTDFNYRDLHVTTAGEGIDVTVSNTGACDGREVVQDDSRQGRRRSTTPCRAEGVPQHPHHFGRDRGGADLHPPRRSRLLGRPVAPLGRGRGGASSRDLRLSDEVEVEADAVPRPCAEDSTIGELLAHPAAAKVFAQAVRPSAGNGQSVASDELGIDAGASQLRIPVGRVRAPSGGRPLPRTELERLLDAVNSGENDGICPRSGIQTVHRRSHRPWQAVRQAAFCEVPKRRLRCASADPPERDHAQGT